MLKSLDLSDSASWKARFRSFNIPWSQLAHLNPDKGIITSNESGVYQMYAWDVPTGTLTQMTDFATGKANGYISADGRRLYYLHDEEGNEIGHYFYKDMETGETRDISPDMPQYASFYFTESYSGNYYGFGTANQYGFIIYVIDNTTGGDPLFRYESQSMTIGPFLSYDGEVAIVASTEKSGTTDFALEAYDVKTGTKLYELWDGEGTSTQPVGFAKRDGDMRFLATSNQNGYERPLIWNTRTGERFDLPLDHIEGSLSPNDWSLDGRKILLRQVNQATDQLWIYDTQSKEAIALKHPQGTYSSVYFNKAGNLFAHYSNATLPWVIVELDGETGEQLRVVIQANHDLPQSIPFRSVTFTSEGDIPIQAWLATPEGDAPFPTIVHTHGGPTAVQKDFYFPKAQAYLDHGFAFLSINYRGSTTFGKDFQNSILGHLGDYEIEDIEAGVKWLIDEGIAQPDMIIKTGGSYGGYLTLLSMGRLSEYFAGGIAHVAIADWAMMYEDMAETLRGYQRALFGGTPEELPEQHAKSSPVTYAENIKGELLVIQGRNDTRCPSRQMEVYEEKLNELGKSIQVEWYDAGHGSKDNEEQIKHMEMELHFLYRILG